MTITYRYKNIERNDKFGTERIPAIPITLKGKNKLNTLGLLDSGADFSAIPYSMAEVLGLKLNKKPEKIGGIGGDSKAILTSMRINILKGKEDYTFSVPVYAIFDGDDVGVLLGRKGLFEKFKITFVELDQKIQLKRHAAEGEKH